jgi:hypothetical protein
MLMDKIGCVVVGCGVKIRKVRKEGVLPLAKVQHHKEKLYFS